MKVLVLSLLLFVAISCVSTRGQESEPEPLVDVQVQQWMKTHNAKSAEKLPVLVKTDRAVSEYPFLKLVKNNFYGGHATYSDLKKMMQDKHVLRIYTGRKKLHK